MTEVTQNQLHAESLAPQPVDSPELFFALVGPCGSDLDTVVDALEAELSAVAYRMARPIRLASVLHSLRPYEALGGLAHEDERIRRHMDAGDKVRSDLKDGGALAALAIAQVQREREAQPIRGRDAFVFRSLKHKDEVSLLRFVYGSALIVLSVYDEKDNRIDRLTRKIEKTRGRSFDAKDEAVKLIDRDERGNDRDTFGQSIRDTFPLADFFVDSDGDLREQVRRLIHLLFRHPYETPTRDEHSMFMARASALRSADLSRQVGAVIVDKDAHILASGCNEVPRFGGGVYWHGDSPDGRDYLRGEDPNAIMRREILSEVIEEMRSNGWLTKARSSEKPEELVDEALTTGMFDNARVSNLVEFGRIVHAEMNAIAESARRGLSIDGAKLFCTTFPCHGCARHLLASGITEVIYIEPYPKSLAQELYREAISVGKAKDRMLVFRPFLGLAPRKYLEFFEFGKRKDSNGYVARWDPRKATPRRTGVGNEHLLIEATLCVRLREALIAQGWIDDPGTNPATTA